MVVHYCTHNSPRLSHYLSQIHIHPSGTGTSGTGSWFQIQIPFDRVTHDSNMNAKINLNYLFRQLLKATSNMREQSVSWLGQRLISTNSSNVRRVPLLTGYLKQYFSRSGERVIKTRASHLGIAARRSLKTSCAWSDSSHTDGRSSEDDTERKAGQTSSSMESADRQSYLEARRRGVLQGRRRLSPLQRVGGMLLAGGEPPDEINDACQAHPEPGKEQANDGNSEKSLDDSLHSFSERTPISVVQGENPEGVPSRDPLFVDGEYVIITRENLKRQEKLVRLIKLNNSLEFKCKFGNLLHEDIIGHRSGSVFVTGMDIELLIRRPSLEEFVLYMKRTPVIAYPKDCCTMLMMIDASPGDVILEAGSGSGAMTLFLSRAVGHLGHVLSFERVETHQKKARQNFESWQRSWDLSREVKWPKNVSFHQARLEDCDKFIKDLQVDGAIIDMEDPREVMKTMAQRLKSGRAMAVYVANLSQVIDVAEVIRKQQLPLVLETTLEVSHKVWVVNPARRHAGNVLGDRKVADGQELGDEQGATLHGVQYIKDDVPKYLTRPHHVQPSHTAFLVRIRKVKSSSTTFKV